MKIMKRFYGKNDKVENFCNGYSKDNFFGFCHVYLY